MMFGRMRSASVNQHVSRNRAPVDQYEFDLDRDLDDYRCGGFYIAADGAIYYLHNYYAIDFDSEEYYRGDCEDDYEDEDEYENVGEIYIYDLDDNADTWEYPRGTTLREFNESGRIGELVDFVAHDSDEYDQVRDVFYDKSLSPADKEATIYELMERFKEKRRRVEA